MRRFVTGLVLLAACGPKPPVRTALLGDLQGLKRDIDSARRSGLLDHDAVVSLALAVAEREVMSATGPAGARRVRSFRACAKPLEGTIRTRARQTDDVAAELTSILLDLGAVDSARSIDLYANAEGGAWRAVAAAAATRPAESPLRARFFSDPDERVRRAAFRAARAAHAQTELSALLDAARLDPDPESQSLAARAAGAVGGERAVLALKDRWATADDALRIGIVDAWTEPASFHEGGERELSIAAESSTGLAAVSASAALVRAGANEATAANARLRRYILGGSDDEKRLAARVAPLDLENVAALTEASKHASAEIRVVALARLSHVPAVRIVAIHTLADMVREKPRSPVDIRAREAALSALADAGDDRVHATLVANLSAKDSSTRARAARGLIRLGDDANAAVALGDDDVDLRTELSCAIVARANSPH